MCYQKHKQNTSKNSISIKFRNVLHKKEIKYDKHTELSPPLIWKDRILLFVTSRYIYFSSAQLNIANNTGTKASNLIHSHMKYLFNFKILSYQLEQTEQYIGIQKSYQHASASATSETTNSYCYTMKICYKFLLSICAQPL